MKNTAAIILAAGKGTRMKCTNTNKVMFPLGRKPMLSYTVSFMKSAGFSPIIVVVGFAKDSVIKNLRKKVVYAVQDKQLGTAHAFSCGLKMIPENITTIVSVYGDDSYTYSPSLYRKMVAKHKRNRACITLLTIIKDDPTGLGRVIRDNNGKVTGIVEEKDADAHIKKIKEINTGLYVFSRDFVTRYLPLIGNNNKAREYYLTDIVGLAVKHRKKIAVVCEKNLVWRGVNNPNDLKYAQKIIQSYAV